MAAGQNSLLERLRSLGLSDEELFSLFQSASGGHQKTSEKEYVFTSTKVANNQNISETLAKIQLNKDGKIKAIDPGGHLSSTDSQNEFVDLAERWRIEAAGHQILLRPMFSHLPLKGKMQWKDKFRIRPLSNTDKIGKGLSFESLADVHSVLATHLGPPFPFILEVAVPKAEPLLLFDTRGYKLLDQFEALLSVLLSQRLTTARALRKQWTTVWDGKQITNHLLDGGLDIGEDGQQDDFSQSEISEVPTFKGDNYYNHLWSRDNEVTLPPNLNALLEEYFSMKRNIRAAFNRACYWFSLGIVHSREPALQIVSFSNAIECLLPRPSEKQCEHCMKPNGKGPTKLFNEHLEKYAPILPSLERMRSAIYGVRSALVHGSRLDAVDLDWASPLREDQDKAFLTEIVARWSLVNWLADPEKCDPTRTVEHQ